MVRAPAALPVLLLRICAARQQRRNGGGVHVAGSHVQRRVACGVRAQRQQVMVSMWVCEECACRVCSGM